MGEKANEILITSRRTKLFLCIVAGSFALLLNAAASFAADYRLSYSGRLTQADGAPVAGPVDMMIKFWTDISSGNTLGSQIDYTAVPLNQGVFLLPLVLSSAQVEAIFRDGSEPVFIEVTAAGKTYPRQQYNYVPYALRVPVDGTSVVFDQNGNLGLKGAPQASAGSYLISDGSGGVSWNSPSFGSLTSQSVSASTPTSGQVLTFDGAKWLPLTPSFNNGSGSVAIAGVTSVSAGTGLTGGPITSTGVLSLATVGVGGTYTKVATDAYGRVVWGSTLSSSDIPPLPATTIGGASPLGLAVGGTGSTSFTTNGVVLGSAGNLFTTAAGAAFQSLTVPSDGGTPSFNAVNLGQAAAVVGILPPSKGGTGLNSEATFPAIGTIVTEGAIETLTNKTLNGATINGASIIAGSTSINTSGAAIVGALTAVSVTSQSGVTILGNGSAASKLVLNNRDDSNSLSFKTPDGLASSVAWTLPGSDGTSGQILTTNGSGSLSWVSGAEPSGVAGGDLSGSFPSPIVAAIQGQPVANTLPATGQVLSWTGSAWSPQTPSGGASVAIATKSADYTVTAADVGKFFLVSGTNTTLTLPAASSAGAGFTISVKNVSGTTSVKTSGSDQIDGISGLVLASTNKGSMQLVTDGAGWYQVNALGSVSVFCGPNCYANPFAMNIGLAYTQSGKNLTLSNGIWVQSSGNNVLRVDGSDNWHYALNANGKGSSAALLDKTTANLRGRVCPTSVYIDDTNKLASGRCLYYDEGLVWQTLHAAGTSQTVQSTMGLSSWNIDGTGNGTGSAWYEGNIKTCADKGMRLPTFYETSGYYSGGSNKPSDVSPLNINAANGVPAASSGAWTWTSTAYTSITGAYWLWSTSATLVNSFFDYSAVRCVLP